MSLDGQSGFPYVLAAIFVAGLLQVVVGMLKLGRLGEVVPSSVMHGLLAGIGVIILVKQIHVGLGVQSMAPTTVASILEIPKSIFNMNPMITVITLVSLGIMMLYPRVKNKLFHFIPAPVWVLIFAIPVVFVHRHWLVPFFDITKPLYQYPTSELISLPSDIWSAIVFPDFGLIGTANFWIVVFTIMIVTTIETLVATKAVDQLDPLRRKTNLNKDLRGMGISSALSGLLGGLPIVTVVVRSSVNVSNNGRTSLSNLFHGLIILLFLLGLQPVLEQVPLAALAAILIYTGYGLTSPSSYVNAYEKGEEQLLVMVFSVICVLLYGLLWGLFLGLIMTQLVQWVKSRMTIKAFYTAIFSPRIMHKQHPDKYELRLSGIFNFLNLLKLKQIIYKTPDNEKVVITLDEAVLIDHSVMEFLDSYGKTYSRKGGNWVIAGLENHESNSSHPHSMRVLKPQHQHSPRWMTDHQREMMKLAARNHWQFMIGKEFDNDKLLDFPLFSGHPVDYVHNTITGLLPIHSLYFTLQDIVFDEGTPIGKIAYDTTVIIIELREEIPSFALEKEQFYDKILQRVGMKDIEFENDPEFSKKELVQGSNEEATKEFLNDALRAFILENSDYHVESTGSKLLIFNKTERLTFLEMKKLIEFGVDFIQLFTKSDPDK